MKNAFLNGKIFKLSFEPFLGICLVCLSTPLAVPRNEAAKLLKPGSDGLQV